MKGFTLIELLIVIAILAIVGSVAWPVVKAMIGI
jgi:prepilin-type N-terminal cleavage/methylation domain-containing protein